MKDPLQPDVPGQVLFLDESPHAPKKSRRDADRAIAELFADEHGPNPWDALSEPDNLQPVDAAVVAAPTSRPAASQANVHDDPVRSGTGTDLHVQTIIIVLITAAALGFFIVATLMR